MAMIERALFVTGVQRSGTTLLEKLLGAQKSISMLSQPFPLLFTDVKRDFLGGDDAYPLGHLFLESRYEPEQFAAFLGNWRTTAEELEPIFARMEHYSGQCTRFSADERRKAFSQIASTDDFAAVVSTLDRALAHKDANWFGSKETICEEYVPPLLDRGFHCTIILRDPRDFVTSLNHGRGNQYGGARKPTLFNIRTWRKSVAIALAMKGHPRFHHCRYEDLVTDTAPELERLAAAFGLEAMTVPSEVRDASGNPWRGNSSHADYEGISPASVGIYREILHATVAEFVEAACLPELQFLGYPTSQTRTGAIRVLQAFTEPYSGIRGGMEQDTITPENIDFEIRRLERVPASIDDESRRWFLFPQTHTQLREGFRP
ncbi:MAG: hypothetical protein DMF56_02730 [Acidobacteria bacterium]|nr:MAG: hypothetical protein DMF56_02730 [Acidobacteriota bacterium]